MPIILTSNGILSERINESYTKLFSTGSRKAAIVVTADPEYRERNWKAVSTKSQLETIGFDTAFFDIEFSPPSLLLDYDVLFFIGGNPFYLLNQIRRTHTDLVLHELMSRGKVVSGFSAGSIVLGESIALVREFDPQMNSGIDLTDFRGLGLTNINLCPHYSKYLTRYDNFEERIHLVEKTFDIRVTRLNDGEAIIIEDGQVTRI